MLCAGSAKDAAPPAFAIQAEAGSVITAVLKSSFASISRTGASNTDFRQVCHSPKRDLEGHIRIVVFPALDLLRKAEGRQIQVQMPPVNPRHFVLIPGLARRVGDQQPCR